MEKNNYRDNFKLFSINEVAKVFGIRHKNVKQLINTGKLKVIKIGKRIKIPAINITEFINSESNNYQPVTNNNGIISPEELEFKIDSLISEYSKE